MAEMIEVEVVYALADRQVLLKVMVEVGATARQVVLSSGIDRQFTDVDFARMPLGIFGKLLSEPDARVLQEGERIEIYRALLLDPKDIRKQRAAKARQAG